jgi:hypothetical protein
MDTARDAIPDDITILKEALATERAKAFEIAAELAVARAKASEDSAQIAQQKLRIAKLSRGHDLAKAFNYILKRWASFALFLEVGACASLTTPAERGLRGIVLGRKSWLFCGSNRGGQRAAAMYSLIVTANGVDPQTWLADVLSRIAAHPAHRPDELLPWNWTPPASAISVRAA